MFSFRLYWRCRKRYGAFQERVKPLLFGTERPRVLSGPFKGMAYLDEIGFCGPIVPKWLGSYESELHHVWEEIFADPPDLVIDVGSAEGYYSVLLGSKLTKSVIYSFDIDPLATRAQRRLVDLHKVGNVIQRKLCDHTVLNQLLEDEDSRGLIICDIEGGEWDLINPVQCRSLLRANCVIEMHERKGVDFGDDLKAMIERFARTHSHEFLEVGKRAAEDYGSVASSLTEADLLTALDEDRNASRGWLVLRKLR
ncbi:hypothetical protein [Phragmitibacter flavus]|nr:hypothetical protein [Phragmitibacter flavus]